MRRLTRMPLVLLIWVALTAAGSAPLEQDPWFDLVPGHFTFVGRQPDSGTLYSGTAVISASGKTFTLERTIGTKTIHAKGTIEVPNPPGEGKVLRFRWMDGDAFEMTCLVQGDLDNYARLSCFWILKGHEHKAPGLEAYFSTEVWP